MGAGGISIKISGAPETIARLKGYAREVIDKASAAGVYAVANRLVAKALPLTPKRQGTLRSTMGSTLPVVEHGHATCKVGAGGPGVQYAEVQHRGWMERGGKRITFRNYTEPGTGPQYLDRAAEAIRGEANRIFTAAFQAVLKRNGGGGLGPGEAPPHTGGDGGKHGGGGKGRGRSARRRK